MTQHAFILSSGRTGTQFLAHFFDKNFSVVRGVHEPKPSYLLRVAANAHMDGVVPDGVAAALLRMSRPRSVGAALYVESNPFLSPLVGPILEVWPGATIFHIVRDPRDFIRSAINHGSATGVKRLASALIPYWFPRIRTVERSAVARFAAQWRLFNEALHAGADLTDHYHRIHFENLFDEHASGLRQMCAALGLEYPADDAVLTPDQRMNRGQLALREGWRTWSIDECRIVERICGPLMAQYGYGTEPVWQERVTF